MYQPTLKPTSRRSIEIKSCRIISAPPNRKSKGLLASSGAPLVLLDGASRYAGGKHGRIQLWNNANLARRA
jgi:hypothetical protein